VLCIASVHLASYHPTAYNANVVYLAHDIELDLQRKWPFISFLLSLLFAPPTWGFVPSDWLKVKLLATDEHCNSAS
jgi:hypothetical protein